ncbi:MAG: hypothetical protein DI598_02125 [Pseudopedobacter saltans]|uniref:Agmatine deiminase n=1 Tax=Pseudopedobacter saltans TaxID=151895 RepID=A0A2W5F8X2_9SPHI|nr:MAG: hypothetical protein DI598_02125 [Pseudopedobacter saltans]
MVQTDYDLVSSIIIPYPERFYNDYDLLTNFFEELITLIPNNIKIWAITNNQQSINKLNHKFSYKNIDFIGLRGWDEIWLRDCIGFIKDDTIVKPIYDPKYCQCEGDKEYYKKLNGLSNTIVKECIQKEIKSLNLVLDGGNFVCNDKYVFMTDKVYEDNKVYTKKEIDSTIFQSTNLEPIIIERNKFDVIGHMDAYLSFIDNNRAILASYPNFPFLKEDISFIEKLKQRLEQLGICIINMQDRPVDELANYGIDGKKADFSSARGNYLNYLRINNTIILPEYSLPTKKETQYYNTVNQEILEALGFEVLRINCDQLAKLGGVLHCVSFTL